MHLHELAIEVYKPDATAHFIVIPLSELADKISDEAGDKCACGSQ